MAEGWNWPKIIIFDAGPQHAIFCMFSIFNIEQLFKKKLKIKKSITNLQEI